MVESRKIIVTGAAGFIGLHLCKALQLHGFRVIACVRNTEESLALPTGVELRVLGILDSKTNWDSVLEKGDIIVHLAGRAHVLHETSKDPLTEFRAINRDVTKTLALACARKRVSRLVFLSSIGVNGSATADRPFSEADIPAPIEPYAVSKWEAEQEIAVIGHEQGLAFTIIRPPLVYGPGNPGNFLRLLRLAASGLPLPLASFENRRSMIFVRNLVDAVIVSMVSPTAINKTYVVSDRQDVSTSELLVFIRGKLGMSPRLFWCPTVLVHAAASLAGFAAAFEKLAGTLLVDCSKLKSELGWEPPFSLSTGLTETAKWYTDERLRHKG